MFVTTGANGASARTVLKRGRLQREPDPDAGLARRGVEETRVLVRRRLAADQRLLEDVHGLRQDGRAPAELPQELAHARGLRVGAEDVVLEVQRVADLVERAVLGEARREAARVRVDGVQLCEEVDPVGGVQEVVRGALRALLLLCACVEADELADRVPALDEVVHAAEHRLALVGRREAAQVQEAVGVEVHAAVRVDGAPGAARRVVRRALHPRGKGRGGRLPRPVLGPCPLAPRSQRRELRR